MPGNPPGAPGLGLSVRFFLTQRSHISFVDCPESDHKKQKPPLASQNARGSSSPLGVEHHAEIAMNQQGDSRYRATKALIPPAVDAAFARSLDARRFIQREDEDIHRAFCYAMRKPCGLGVFVFGRLHMLCPRLPGEQKAFENERDRAVLSDLPTAAEPINLRFRSREVVHGARCSMSRVHRLSLPRDEIP